MKTVIYILYVLLNILIVGYPIPQIVNVEFFSESSALYLFSALLQSNAAILSIVGVFIIFKIQFSQSSIDIIKTALMNDRGRTVWPITVIEFDSFDLAGKKKYLEGVKRDSSLHGQYSRWIAKEEYISKIKSSIKNPTILISIGLLINAIGLFCANYIHTSLKEFEFRISVAIVLFEMLIIYHVGKTILNAMTE